MIYENKVNFHGLNIVERKKAENLLKSQIEADFEIKFTFFLKKSEEELKLDEQDANMFKSI